MSFPLSPTNNQQATVNGITYAYSTVTSAWTRVSLTPILVNTGSSLISGTWTFALSTSGSVTLNGSPFVSGGSTSASGTGTTTTFVISNTTISTGTNSGALQVAGGAGIGGDLYVGGTTSSFIGNVGIGTLTPTWKVDTNLGTINGTSTATGGYNIFGDAGSSQGYTTYNMQLNNAAANASGYMRLARTAGTTYLGMQIASQSRDGIAFLTGATTLVEQVRISATGTVTISTTTNATSTTTGALQVIGGAGIGGDLYVGGTLTVNGTKIYPMAVQNFTAAASTTTFTISGGYSPSANIQVFANGLLLPSSDYTASNGTTIILTQPRNLNDQITIIFNPNSAPTTSASPNSLAIAIGVALGI
jgi:hypothetical protein